ncbi:MAG: response regulator transcription factor [Actinomycetota bacterium]
MQANPHILVVVEEVKLAQFIELELKCEGYQVTVVNNGLGGLAAAEKLKPDLMIVDGMLPSLSGLELCRRLRIAGDMVPVILLTLKEEVSDRVAGLDAGADDYIVKPFNVEQLLIRVRAHLKPSREPDPDLLQFADLSLNRRTRKVYRGSRSIDLTVKEFDLLEYLLSNPREVLTRDRILQTVWGSDYTGDSNIIEVYIRYLRLKLEASEEKRLIQTVRGLGYVLRD